MTTEFSFTNAISDFYKSILVGFKILGREKPETVSIDFYKLCLKERNG